MNEEGKLILQLLIDSAEDLDALITDIIRQTKI